MWLGVGMAAAALLFLIVRGPVGREDLEYGAIDDAVTVG